MNDKSKITGGPERQAFNKENVVPINFSNEDPFWDISGKCIEMERECREGEVIDVLIIKRSADNHGYRFAWRGISSLSSMIGTIEMVKHDLLMSKYRTEEG